MEDVEKKGVPLPEKEEGGHKDIEVHEKLSSIDEAKQLFATAKGRLLQVNQWDKICGKASAVFKLTDERGREVEGEPKPGYYFKIDVPGPGSKSGEGYDWVKVEAIEEKKDDSEDREFILIRVRPTDNPTIKNENVAHFFSDKATSNFLVMREENKVTAAVLGRNEVPNTSATESFLDKIRNAIVGTGAVAGISNLQWKSLVNGLIKRD
jgi:hypothetical protein